MSELFEYEDTVGELIEKISDCHALLRKIYGLSNTTEESLVKTNLRGIVDDLEKVAQKVGWIDRAGDLK